jgi:hypothetical protein
MVHFPLDRVVALIIVVAIAKTGWDLLAGGMRVLLDASLDAETLLQVREIIAAEPMERTHLRYAVSLADPDGAIGEHLGEAPYFALVRVRLAAAILSPPAGNLVEPVLSQLEKGGTLRRYQGLRPMRGKRR